MRKIILIAATAMCFGAVTISAPNNAQARFGAEAIAQATAGISSAEPARNYRSRRNPGYYGAFGSASGANYWYNAPAAVYSGSREALDSCYYC